jgi:hypothetical protein
MRQGVWTHAARMHYKVFLPHLAHASTRAFPVCYMNDIFPVESHADLK